MTKNWEFSDFASGDQFENEHKVQLSRQQTEMHNLKNDFWFGKHSWKK